MKKVLGIVISHRRLGNSEILVKEIMSSIPEPCSLELIRLTDLKIEPCKACYRCLQPEQECPVKDDFNFVFSRIKVADAVIIGVPVYILGPHGYYKMLTDRLLGAENQRPFTEDKPCVIVMPYAIPNWRGYSRASAMVTPGILGMKLIDCWQVCATLPGESLLNPDNLHYAQCLGRSLFQGPAYQPGPRDCSYCGSDLLRLLPGNRLECPICGAQATLQGDNLPDFSATEYYRFSAADSKEHFEWLKTMKHRFWEEKDYLKDVQKNYKDKNWWVKPKL